MPCCPFHYVGIFQHKKQPPSPPTNGDKQSADKQFTLIFLIPCFQISINCKNSENLMLTFNICRNAHICWYRYLDLKQLSAYMDIIMKRCIPTNNSTCNVCVISNKSINLQGCHVWCFLHTNKELIKNGFVGRIFSGICASKIVSVPDCISD